MRVNNRTVLPVVLALGLTQSCVKISKGKTASWFQSEKTKLTVSLFPFIPDVNVDGLVKLQLTIESEFEKKHPDIDLHLVSSVDASPYKPDWIKTEFVERKSKIDVLEIDAIMFDEIQPESFQKWPDFPALEKLYPPAKTIWQESARKILPTKLCSYFVFESGLENFFPSKTMVGDVSGQFAKIALYLTARGNALETEISSDSLNQESIQAAQNLVKPCQDHFGNNPCANGSYDKKTAQYEMMVKGHAHLAIGYSEIASHFVAEGKIQPHKITAKIVKFDENFPGRSFVNGFVLSSQCNEKCKEAAINFAAFFQSPEIQTYLMLGLDATPRRTRYTIPAYQHHTQAEGVSHDPLYRSLIVQTIHTKAFPVLQDLFKPDCSD